QQDRFGPATRQKNPVFFFTSRRRHTSSDRDWSSDVCSSDLVLDLVIQIRLLRTEKTDLNHKIEDLESILASKDRVLGILKTEFLEIREKFGDDRRTTVELQAYDMEVEDLIPEENVVVTITNTGYIKRVPATVYR